MKLYHYSHDSGEFTHATNAQENPRDKGKYFEQAHSTFTPVPELQPTEIAIRDIKNNTWLISEDHRGKIWDIKTKEQSELTELGPIPKGKTNKEPGRFDNWNGSQWVLDIVAQLENTQLTALGKIRELATKCRKSIAGSPDHLETAEWPEKRLRALRVVDGSPLVGDLEKFKTEALYRNKGETAEQLAVKVASKAERFEHASIVITGMTAAAISAVKATATIDEIETLYASLKIKASEELEKLA